MKNEEFEKVITIPVYDYARSSKDGKKYEIPEGVTHVELEIDYSGCYYSHDTPDYNINFYKRKQ